MAPPPTAQHFLTYTVLLCMTIRTTWLALAGAVLALATGAPPASAAFAGANGKLAVTPLSGAGLIIASPQTGRAHRVCGAPQNCGLRLTDPRFSANGREVVFRDAAGQLQVTTPSGTCVFCLSSHPLWNLDGTSPALAPNGKTITYVHRGLWQVTPGSTSPRRLLNGPVTSAVWSQSHQLLVTRRGSVWTGRPTAAGVLSLRRVVRGGAPAASPTGGELAYTRDGSVFTLRLAGHKITRIARGSAPTFSPNGNSLAYLNQHHQVTIRPLGHGRARTLTRLRGRSLDWQPITTVTRKGCEAANGVVVAADSAATIRAAADNQDFEIVWNGCLQALGVPVHLTGGLFGDGGSITLGEVAFAGNYAALQLSAEDKMGDFSDTVDVFDLRSGALVHTAAAACDGFPCGVSGLAVNADGFAAWHAYDTPHVPESQVTATSCAAPTLCVAGDNAGKLLVSTNPAAGRAAWTQVQLPQPPDVAPPEPVSGVSCPTASFCVAVDQIGDVFWSTDPAGGPDAWHAASVRLLGPINELSCASPTLCAATGGETVYATTDPTAAAAWHATALTPIPDQLTGVACPSTTLCVAATSSGEVLTSQDPGDPTPDWTSPARLTGATPQEFIASLNCPTTSFCSAVSTDASGASGAVLTTTNPAGGAGTWTTDPLGQVSAVTCPDTSLCVALDGANLLTSTDPTDPSPAWTTTAAPPLPVQPAPVQPTLADCPTTSLCVAFAQPYAIASANPTGGASAWTSFLVDALPCDPATPCRAEALQAVDDQGAHTLDTAPQGSGTVISDPALSGDTLTWTDGGTSRSAGLS